MVTLFILTPNPDEEIKLARNEIQKSTSFFFRSMTGSMRAQKLDKFFPNLSLESLAGYRIDSEHASDAKRR